MAKKAKETEEQDLTESFAADMSRRRPTCSETSKQWGGTYDIQMSDKDILGDVKYVLLTGNEAYDRIVGGFPFGRISEVFGLENCGKTAMMVRTMCRFQHKHIYEVVSKEGFIYKVRRVDPSRVKIIKCYVDNEHSLEKGFKVTITDVTINEKGEEVIEHLGMKAAIMTCDTVDHIFAAVDRFIATIKAAQKAIEAEGGDEIVFGVFTVDTIAGTSSKEELQREWGKRDYSRQSQQISEGFRCITNEISRHNVAMICTNQVRGAFKQQAPGSRKIFYSTPQADDFSTFGGKALAFYASHRVFMFRVPVKYTLVKGAQFPAGYLIGFRTEKNRLRKPGREARMVLLFDEEVGGLHNVLSLLESMLFLRVAEYKEGKFIFKFKANGVETTTFAEDVMLADPDLEAEESKKKVKKKRKEPSIAGRYEWIGFYKAHRNDLDKLWEVAMRKAYETPGLSEFYEPDPEEVAAGEGEDDEDEEFSPPAPRGKKSPAPVEDDD